MDTHDGGVLRGGGRSGSSLPLCEVRRRFSSAAATTAVFSRVPLSVTGPNFIVITAYKTRGGRLPASLCLAGWKPAPQREEDLCPSIKACGARTNSPALATC